MVDGQLRAFIILSPKYTKITTFLQLTPKPENILERLENNFNVFEKTYIPWLKVGKIHGISVLLHLRSIFLHKLYNALECT